MNSTATKEINLNLPLSSKEKIASTMPDMKNNLISIPQLVNDDCTCQLQKIKPIVQCGDTTSICDREHKTGLWAILIEKNENGDKKQSQQPIRSKILFKISF